MLKFDSTFGATMVVICTLGGFIALGSFSYARYPAPKPRHEIANVAKPVDLHFPVSYDDQDQKEMDALLEKAEREHHNRSVLAALFNAEPVEQ